MRTPIMSTTFFPRPVMDEGGHVDEGMGVGSSGWYGERDKFDLLLRVLDAGGWVDYDPDPIGLQNEPCDEADATCVRKVLRYGCGDGHLWRLHRLPRSQLHCCSTRKAGAAVVRTVSGRRELARSCLAHLQETWAGWTGRRPAEPPEGTGS